jgi:hypothetical protein
VTHRLRRPDLTEFLSTIDDNSPHDVRGFQPRDELINRRPHAEVIDRGEVDPVAAGRGEPLAEEVDEFFGGEPARQRGMPHGHRCDGAARTSGFARDDCRPRRPVEISGENIPAGVEQKAGGKPDQRRGTAGEQCREIGGVTASSDEVSGAIARRSAAADSAVGSDPPMARAMTTPQLIPAMMIGPHTARCQRAVAAAITSWGCIGLAST